MSECSSVSDKPWLVAIDYGDAMPGFERERREEIARHRWACKQYQNQLKTSPRSVAASDYARDKSAFAMYRKLEREEERDNRTMTMEERAERRDRTQPVETAVSAAANEFFACIDALGIPRSVAADTIIENSEPVAQPSLSPPPSRPQRAVPESDEPGCKRERGQDDEDESYYRRGILCTARKLGRSLAEMYQDDALQILRKADELLERLGAEAAEGQTELSEDSQRRIQEIQELVAIILNTDRDKYEAGRIGIAKKFLDAPLREWNKNKTAWLFHNHRPSVPECAFPGCVDEFAAYRRRLTTWADKLATDLRKWMGKYNGGWAPIPHRKMNEL